MLIIRDGDPSNRSLACMVATVPTACLNVICVYSGYDGELWHCKLCGRSFSLNEDEVCTIANTKRE